MSIMNKAIVYDNVILGENSIVEPFSILGISPSKLNIEVKIGNKAVIRSGTYIYEGNNIGDNFQTGNKTNIRENNNIGDNVSIGTNSIVEHHIQIDDNVRIHSNCFIPEFTILKKNSWIGPSVTLTNAKFPVSKHVKDNLKGPIIMENAIIGANSTILPAVKIGKFALVGAGSIITKDVPNYAIVIGTTQKIVGDIRELKDENGVMLYEF